MKPDKNSVLMDFRSDLPEFASIKGSPAGFSHVIGVRRSSAKT